VKLLTVSPHAKAEKRFPLSSGPDYIGKQKEYINDWNQTHFYVYKAAAQSAWMDWVVNGQKYDVDYNFGLIDIDSIAAQLEELRKLREEKARASPVSLPVITGATAPQDANDKKTLSATLVAPKGSELAGPIFGIKKQETPPTAAPTSTGGSTTPATTGGGARPLPPSSATDDAAAAEMADPWTTISFSYSAADQKSATNESSWGMKVGGSYSHDESHKNMQHFDSHSNAGNLSVGTAPGPSRAASTRTSPAPACRCTRRPRAAS